MAKVVEDGTGTLAQVPLHGAGGKQACPNRALEPMGSLK